MVAIPVEEYLKYDWAIEAPHTPERKGPFEVYDCLKPYSGSLIFKDGVAAVYFSMWIPQDATVGAINGTIKVGEMSIPITIEVSSAVVPEETLDVAMLRGMFVSFIMFRVAARNSSSLGTLILQC